MWTQKEAGRLEDEQDDDDDWGEDVKDKRTRKKLTIKKKNVKVGYIF